MVAAIVAVLFGKRKRHPPLSRRGEPRSDGKARRHHADHLIIPVVQDKLSAEGLRCGAEVALREAMAEYNDGVPARLALGFGKGPAHSSLCPEDGKEIRVCHRRENGLGPRAATDAQSTRSDDGHRFEDMVLSSPIEIICHRCRETA